MKRIIHLLLASALPLLLTAQTFFISPTGNDTSPGTEDRPFRTLEGARDAIRRLRETDTRQEKIRVLLEGGFYRLARTFELTAGDGGTVSAPVIYEARPGAAVRISGGEIIPGSSFRRTTDREILRRLPREARAAVVVADLRPLGITNFGSHRQFGFGQAVIPAPLELFWNDNPLPLARYPNEGGILMGAVTETGSIPRIGDMSNRPGRFLYTDPRHARWAGTPDVWLQGYFHHGYADDKIGVTRIDTVRREISLASPHVYGLGSGENFNLYVALNLLEELDQPGEWYLDRSTGRLYIWPPSDPRSARISVSILEEPVIALDRASHIELRGLIVEAGRGIGIYAEGGEGVTIADCVVRNLGTVGIMFGQGARQGKPGILVDSYTGSPVSREVGTFSSHFYLNTTWERNSGTQQRIDGCEIYNTGSGGIILGGGSKKGLLPGGNRVSDCRIHDFDRRNKAGAAGISLDGCGNVVAHNEIYNGDLQAIMVRGNDHLFEYNVIHDVARNSNDASAWYLGRDPSDQGNIVRWNFFHHVGRPDRKWTMGVYCDDATCGVTIEGNVFYRVASYGTVYSNGGHDIAVRNNIFIEGYGPAYLLKSMWYDFGLEEISYFFSDQGIYTTRLTKSVNIRTPPYSTRYPLLQDWLDLLPDGRTFVGMRPRRNVVENNVLVWHEETFRLVAKYAQTEFGENYITKKDPGFVDAKRMDFRLKPDSPVYRELPGFKPIPFEKMGPRRPAGPK